MPNYDNYLVSSPRMANYDNELQKLYVAYFARPADPVGLNYWNSIVTAAIAAGQSVDAVLNSVANSFTSSPEFQASFSGLNSDLIVSKIYQNLFSHAPDPLGLIYWSAKLSTGALTPGQIITEIVSYATSDPSGADGIAFKSKVAAANAFTSAIDTVDETVGYSGAIANNLAKAFISSVNSSGTLAVETTPENLADTIHNVTTAKALPPVDFGQKDITQKVDNYANNTGQKLDLGAGLKIHSAVPLTDVPGIKMPNTLKYSIDANGVIQFSGSLEITKAYSDREKAAIIEKILGDDHSSLVFYKSGSDVFAFANNGDASSTDHLVKITGIADQFQGGHLNFDGSITADVGQFGGGSNGGGGGQLCDRRLKTNIRLLSGSVYSFNIYSFNYIGDDRVFVGPMAQELLADERYCHVVSKNKQGFYHVDFRALGINHLASSDMMSARNITLQKQITAAV